MALVTLDIQDTVAILRLTNGITNAIGPPLLDAIDEALAGGSETWSGLVLAGNEKFFSMGFDLPHLLQLERGAMAAFFERFNALCSRLYTLPMPTVCAIAGHAVAGGCILALTCDYRLVGDGRQKIGLNEVPLGVPVPYLADLMLRQIAGDRTATAMAYEGHFMGVDRALEEGVVDSSHPTAEVEAAAARKARQLAALPKAALAAVKAQRVAAVAEQYGRHCRAMNTTFLDCWFSEATRPLLEAAARKF